MNRLHANERYVTSLQNSMAVISADMKDDPGLQIRRLGGAHHTQTEFLYSALNQILEEIQTLRSEVRSITQRAAR